MDFCIHSVISQKIMHLEKIPHRCSSIYVEKIVKNHLYEDMTILRGRGCLVTKININFFVRNEF